MRLPIEGYLAYEYEGRGDRFAALAGSIGLIGTILIILIIEIVFR
jgi:hypothetical protein